jgi:hypothetical protein
MHHPRIEPDAANLNEQARRHRALRRTRPQAPRSAERHGGSQGTGRERHRQLMRRHVGGVRRVSTGSRRIPFATRPSSTRQSTAAHMRNDIPGVPARNCS